MRGFVVALILGSAVHVAAAVASPHAAERLRYAEACDPGPIAPMDLIDAEAAAIDLALRAHLLELADPPDFRRAAQLYCQALRLDGEATSAFSLSRLFAHGAGVPRSSWSADHFARVALALFDTTPSAFDMQRAETMLRELDSPGAPAGAVFEEHYGPAQRWLIALQGERVGDVVERAHAYLAGDGVPVSGLLAERLLRSVWTRSPAGTFAYASHMLHAHPERVTSETVFGRSLLIDLAALARFDRHPPAQALYGALLLAGDRIPGDPYAAYVWLQTAHLDGVVPTVPPDRALSQLPPAQRERAKRQVELELEKNRRHRRAHL